MDGTLIDSATDITITINHIRKKNHALEPLSSEEIIASINGRSVNLAKAFYNTEEYQEEDQKAFESHYWDQCIQNVEVYGGVRELISGLKEDGHFISVATNAPSIFARKMLKHVGLLKEFDYVFGSCDVQNQKPDPEIIHKILRFYRYHKGAFLKPIMIGDSHKDMEAAKNAEIDALYVKWGFKNDDDTEAPRIRSTKELMQIVIEREE
jgi:phosphoglycolate phosphatase